MPPVEKRSLLSRSPRSRKSLAEASSGQSPGPARRKRAYSIAPGENLKTDVARRRSLLRPKGILKPSNQADQTQDMTQDISDAYQSISPTTSLNVSETTGNMSGAVAAEFHTNVHDNQSRRSFGGRRVSFAAHAHVRVFTAANQNTNGTSSPASSPSTPTPSESSRSPPPRYDEVTPRPVHWQQSPSRRSSLPIPQYEEDGEESMDVSADDIPSSTIVTPFPPRLESGSTLDDHNAGHDSEEGGEGEDDGGDMSMTGHFGSGIVSRRRTMSMAVRDRRSSRMRSSITIPPSENGRETKEFTVSVDRPPPPESDAFRALKAIANENRSDEDNSAASENGEVDMDVTTAVSRLLAVRESTGGHLPPDDRVEDSFTTTEDSFDDVDAGERTMNMTNLMKSFHASDYGVDDEGDVIMSAASMVGPPTSTYPAPIPSLTQAEIIDPGQWATTVQGGDVPQDDLAPISVDQFFTMTGIRFMDDMTCPRRSTVHPSQLQRRESNDGEEDTYPLSDYAVAMAVDIAQLETMSWIANDIRSAIDKYKAQHRETEEDAAKDIPFLFREYATVSEEDREKILYVLKLIKAHTILSAKGSWYEWKRGWVQGLLTNAERTLDNLDADERQLANISKRAEQTIPGLRREYEEITRELEQERAAVAEIENCDQTFLSELKATIAEQRQELDVYRNDIAEGNTKLARLEETLEDLEDQGRDAKTAIATAQRQMEMQKTSTRAEVFRLRDELKNLQDLHLWRATQLNAELVEMIYDSKYRVTIPCRRYLPIPEALDVAPFGDQSQADDDFPLVTELMYRLARRKAVQNHENKLTLRMIVQRLTDFWASYAQLRWQLSFIIIKYPLSFQLIPAGSKVDDAEGFKVTATLLLFKKTSKALISFHFDSELLNYWPVALDLLKFDVSIAYGMADPKVVGEALQTRLSEASPADNHACLVDACMEVVSRYS